MSRLGIVTGLSMEAARIRTASRGLQDADMPIIGVAGGSAERAAGLARQQVAAGARALVSFGLAGGLDPSLLPGDIVIGATVWRNSGPPLDMTGPWAQSIAAGLQRECRVRIGGVAGVDAPAVSVAAKAALRLRSGALAVDMESHGTASAAAELGIPILVIRAVADPSMRAVPAAALAGMGSDGRRRPFAVLGRLLFRPSDLPGLIRLAGDSAAAMRSLAVAARVLFRETGSD
ncbi:MAG: hypothetical protein WD767_20265 [Alphaproteobacteria bacterium]